MGLAPRRTPLLPLLALVLAACLFWLAIDEASAQRPASPAASRAPAGGVPWASLSAAQRGVLAPLQRDWNELAPENKQKWVEMANRYPKLPEADRARIKERMAAWARMTPQERERARAQFQQTRKLSPQERHERWQQYQALPAGERQQFAASRPKAPAKEAARERPLAKSNLVPNPALSAPPKTVTPIVVQAKPGATTNLISRPGAPPPHQQAGLPKITATPGLVDAATLLPRRGPQAAAARMSSPDAQTVIERP